MKPFQFGLRLFLLVITFLAVCFAWLGADQSKELYEREIVRMRCEAMVAAEEKWRATVTENMKRPPGDPQAMPRIHGLAHLKYSESRIAAIRKELDSMK